MTCAELQQWLDEGQEQGLARAALAHADSCPACARALDAAETIDATLGGETREAPAGFTARVMARIEREALERVPRWLPALAGPPALPWWIRVAGEPATVMALLAAGLLAWGWDALWTLAAGMATWAAGTATRLLDVPGWRAGLDAHLLEAALACLALFYSQALYRWVSRFAGRSTPLRGPRSAG